VPGRRAARAFRPKLRWLYLYLPLLIVALLIGGVAWAFTSYRGIERIDLQGALDPVTGDFTNYLLVGSDSREGLDPDVPVGGESTVTGKRSDTIILLHVGPDGSSMTSIPRDLWVTNAATGKQGRINAAYNAGPSNLVLTVKKNLDVPVHHYMEVGFDSFAGVVDAVGGIELEVAHPAFDEHSGLLIETPGKVTLDGDQALAYVRSRHYTEVIDGHDVEDPTADIGRQHRQQVFLQTALAEVGSTRNPITLLRSASAMSKGLTIDDQTGFGDLVGLARDMSAQSPKSVVLPTKPVRKGGAAVLVLD